MMNKATSVYAALAALLAAADARNLNKLPRATAASDYAFDGFSPKPTEAINFPFHQALQRRAGSASTSSPTVVYLAPDATCGYISGLAGAGYTCGVSATCVFFTSSALGPGHVACCDTQDCNVRNVCIDYEGYFSQSKCNDGCKVDTFTLKCTNSALPYCNTISFPGDITDVFCNNAQITGVQAALTTYRGESSRRFSPLTLSDSPQSTIANDFTSPTQSSPSSTSETAPATTTPAPSGGGGSNTGAIVGGVVGGVGGLALIGLAAFFFLRRKKTHSAVPQEATPQIPPVYQTPPGMQQTPQGPYDPKFAAATGQYPQYQQGYYQTTPEGHTISPVDPRYSTISSSTSPAPSGGYVAPGPGAFQPQENVIHEAPAQNSENHRGEMHELA
ncbi:hypothetical protein THARTR1_06470 [Trichoderma harzianum]|uniref:Uncharacterized protein n=1 Tax=Trichoderma harzianum TaxID=5544 RepID=A0A2K0U597_TRIHA|nr:hypothetical protein THARTR1_06470 [Trichoderma harzianum]